MKKGILIGFVILAVLIAAVVLVPAFIDLGAHKGRYLPLVEEALHRQVDVGEVRLRLIPSPAIRLSNLKVADHPAFSKNPFFTAQQIRLKLNFWPLLRGKFQVTEFVLERPVINLLKQPDGTFNFADMTKKKEARPTREEPRKKEVGPRAAEPIKLSEWVPARLRIEDGELTLQTQGQKPLKIQGIDLSLQDFSAERPFPYRAALKIPGLKPISLEGLFSYQENQATLNLKNTQLKAQDVVFAVNGAVSHLNTVPRVNLTLANDRFETKPIFDLLSALGVTPKELEVAGPMGLRVALAGPSNSLSSQVRTQFKGLKVREKRALTGTLDGEISLNLPMGGDAPLTRSLRGSGKLAAKDGELTNVDLISKVQRITGFLGLPPQESRDATTFKTLEAEFAVGEGIVDFKRIFLLNPMMEAHGGGIMTLNEPRLNLAIETVLSSQVSARAGSGQTATFFKDNQGRIVVPLKITGPLEKPSVNLDSEKLLKKGMGQMMEKRAGSFFERLFRRK